MREVIALLRERLGRMTRPIWVVLPCDPDNTASRFERRGLTPVVLDPGTPREKPPEVLAHFFGQLRSAWERAVEPQIDARLDATTAELQRNSDVAPQMALFVAGRSMLDLFRDLVFPAIPRSGFIPPGVDDVRARDPRVRPMATDIALAKAAVVVYDTAAGNALTLDYVATRRGGRPLIVVTDVQADRDRDLLVPPGTVTLHRPSALEGWEDDLAENLVAQLSVWRSWEPPLLNDLAGDRELLLTSLALLEAQLRGSDAPGDGPTIMSTGGRMSRLRSFFGTDFDAIAQAVEMRHDLVQGLQVAEDRLHKAAEAVSRVAIGRQVAK